MARSRYTLTEAKIARFAKEGRGQGRGPDYRPWFTINDFPSRGLTSRGKSRTSGRAHTLFSTIEMGVFLEADWDDSVVDIREQFPLPRAETIALAAAMGVRHPGADGVDAVMTTDLLLDVPATAGAPAGLVAVSCKDSSELGEDRTLEKLEIERRYWAGRHVPVRIVTEREVSGQRVRTLELLAERRSFDGVLEPRPGHWRDVCRRVLAALPSGEDATLGEAMARLERAHGWPTGDALSGLIHLAANRLVPIDIAAGFDPRGPVSLVRVQPAAAGAVAA